MRLPLMIWSSLSVVERVAPCLLLQPPSGCIEVNKTCRNNICWSVPNPALQEIDCSFLRNICTVDGFIGFLDQLERFFNV